MDPVTYPAVRACALVLLAGAVLHGPDVTAGNGLVIDWRTVRCGETLTTDADPFDVAHLFVALVGPEAALLAALRDHDVEDAPAVAEPLPAITAWAPDARGRRCRQFEVGEIRVQVQAIDWLDAEDEHVAALAERLAVLAHRARVGGC